MVTPEAASRSARSAVTRLRRGGPDGRCRRHDGSMSWTWTSRSKERPGTSRWSSAIASLEVPCPSRRRCPNRRRGRRAARRRGGPRRPRIGRRSRDASSASALVQREGERLIVGIEVGGDGEDPIAGPRPRRPAADGDARMGRRRRRVRVPRHVRGRVGSIESVPTSEPCGGSCAPAARCSPRAGSHHRRRSAGPPGGRRAGAVVGTSRPRGFPRPRRSDRSASPASDRRLDSPPHGVPHRPGRPAPPGPPGASARRCRADGAGLGDAAHEGLRGRPPPGDAAGPDRRGEARVTVGRRDRGGRERERARPRVRGRRRDGRVGPHRTAALPRLARGSAGGPVVGVDPGPPEGLRRASRAGHRVAGGGGGRGPADRGRAQRPGAPRAPRGGRRPGSRDARGDAFGRGSPARARHGRADDRR